MRSKTCKFCHANWTQAVGMSFRFPHCEAEQNSRIKARLKFLDTKTSLTAEEKKERGRLMKALLKVRYATPSKNPNL